MSVESQLLNALKAEAPAYAVQALKNTGERSEFDFGFRAGYIAGLAKAEELLLALLREERDGEG